MSTGAFALLRFADTGKLLPAVKVFETSDHVSGWHAVDGHNHLVIKLASTSPEFISVLGGLEGLDALELCELTDDASVEDIGNFTADPEKCYAYLYLEVEKDKQNNIIEFLESDHLPFVMLAVTDRCLVAVVEADNFTDVKRVADETVRPLDGMLRVKTDLIIDLMQL